MPGTDGRVVVGPLRPFCRRELQRDPVSAARALLNALLSCSGRLVRIVEVEAYEGSNDPASHAFGGRTPRNATMFAEAGHLYVYLSYGIHHCANVVCGPAGEAGAVLLRAATPVAGLEGADVAAGRLGADRLASGPGRLCRALGITRAHDGIDLLDPGAAVRLWRDDLVPPRRALCDGRVGLSERCGDALYWPWRFVVPGAAAVSRPVPGRRARRPV